MFRSFKVVASFSVLATLVACGGSSSEGAGSGSAGKSALSTLSPEPAGSGSCAAGGTRVATGLDLNESGVLDADEVKSSQVICNGSAGKDGANGANGAAPTPSPLMNVDTEAKGTNCKAGGIRIQSGIDSDGNRTLDAAEVTATKFVCNGDPTVANGPTPAVSVFTEGLANVDGAALITAQTATIKAPGKGKVIAFSNADIFCASPANGGGYDCRAAGITSGNYTLSTSATAVPSTGSYDYFFLTPNATENSARTAVFDVAAAGDVSVYLRASGSAGQQYGFFRRQLTLIFIPAE